MTKGEPNRKLQLVVPIYNDWKAAAMLLDDLDRAGIDRTVNVLFVDDASMDAPAVPVLKNDYAGINEIRVIRLNRNMGHQRATAIGMAFASANLEFDCLVVMDGDGEDRPRDIPVLLEKLDENGGNGVVFAQRRRRPATVFFRLYYLVYLVISKILTGFAERIGNFSALSPAAVSRLIQAPEILIHYSSAVKKLRIPCAGVKIDKGARYYGTSKMGFTGLVMHGLLAIAVHREKVAIRVFMVCALASLSLVAGIPVIAVIRFFTDLAIPGWATNLTGMLLILLGQLIGLGLFIIFIMLGNRSLAEVVPGRDFASFIQSQELCCSRKANTATSAAS